MNTSIINQSNYSSAVPEHFTQQGILNSNYKNLVKENFSKNDSNVFGIKQRIKSSQYGQVNHFSGMIKFGIALLLLISFL